MLHNAASVSNYYYGKSVFITGGFGSLGKILIEKLLRCCAGVGKIYLLVRPNKKYSASERLTCLLNTPLFSKISEKDPDAFNKLVLMEGDLNFPNIGLSEADVELFKNEVSIVFHCAAVLRFDKPLREMLSHNMFSTRRLLHLCYKTKKLEAFIYVSTLYSMSHNKDIDEHLPIIPECDTINFECSDEDEIIKKIPPSLPNKWPNTYTFSKALTEILLDREKRHLPICIVRPSIILSTLKDPLPGWIDNVYGPTLILMHSALGSLKSAICDLSRTTDLIPSDIVVNLLICAAWKVSQDNGKQTTVYNCCSGERNPVKWRQLTETYGKYCKIYLSSKTFRYPHITYYTSYTLYSLHYFLQHYLVACVLYLITRKTQMLRLHKFLTHICRQVADFSLYEWNVNDVNVLKLSNELCKDDRETFFIDVKDVNWHTYFKDYTIGVKFHLFKENVDNIEVVKERLNTLYWREVLLQILIWSSVIIPLYYLFKGFFN